MPKSTTKAQKIPFTKKGEWWVKKHLYRQRYLTKVADDPEAIQAAIRFDRIRNGLPVDGDSPTRLTIGDAWTKYVDACRKRVDPKTADGYKATGDRFTKHLGTYRMVESLKPIDFANFRSKIEDTDELGLYSINNAVQHVRSWAKWLYEMELIEKPLRFGPEFGKSKPEAIRRHRHETQVHVEPCIVRRLIDAASPQVAAMILLGANCGMTAVDFERLQVRDFDLRTGWLDTQRHKRAIQRRSRLWPTTIATIEKVKQGRDLKPTDLVFRTKYGKPWRNSAVAHEFSKLFNNLGIEPSLRFQHKQLRKVHQTEAEAAGCHPIAIRRAMGHTTDIDIGSHYRTRVDDRQLERVSQAVHEWLYGSKFSTDLG